MPRCPLRGRATCDHRDMPLANETVDVLGVALTTLHIAFAAIWFGHKLALPADARASIHGMEGPEAGLVGRLRRAVGLDVISATGAILTGGLMAYRAGLGEIRITVWLGAAVAVGLIVFAVLVTRPARAELRGALLAGLRPEATAAAKRVANAVNLEGFLWLAALVLMVV